VLEIDPAGWSTTYRHAYRGTNRQLHAHTSEAWYESSYD